MKWVVVETPYDEQYITPERFRPEGFRALQKLYQIQAESIVYDKEVPPERNYMRAYYWDDETGQEEDIPGLPGVLFADLDDWME